jgi:3,4-dihydroxy 2-butanone 4-phosphate synthase/GTP cyclohydrolase II
MNEDGSMARVPELTQFCQRHGLKMISVASLIRHRHQTENLIQRRAEGCLETEFGTFKTVTFGSTVNDEAHLALVHGDVRGKDNVLVRMHSRCVLGDVFGSTACNCGAMLRASLKRITDEGEGVLVYLHQSGWGERKHIPLPDGSPRHLQEFGIGAQIYRSRSLHHPHPDQPRAQAAWPGRVRYPHHRSNSLEDESPQ